MLDHRRRRACLHWRRARALSGRGSQERIRWDKLGAPSFTVRNHSNQPRCIEACMLAAETAKMLIVQHDVTWHTLYTVTVMSHLRPHALVFIDTIRGAL